jgi:putative DNA primase/helicase
VLPIGRAPGKKYPPPLAFTGHGQPDPSGADIQTWLDGPEQAYNIGLRLPAGVIGLDVDAYAGKRGGESLAELVARLGDLPPTWLTSARTDGVSGIRLFRVPLELDGREVNWPGEAGKHIEIIQHGHRYAVAWPSTNPEADGAEYRWRWSEGGSADAQTAGVPTVDELSWLPERWLRGLMLDYARTDKATLDGDALSLWWSQLR